VIGPLCNQRPSGGLKKHAITSHPLGINVIENGEGHKP